MQRVLSRNRRLRRRRNATAIAIRAACLAAALVLFSPCWQQGHAGAASANAHTVQQAAERIVFALNAFRARSALPPLRTDPTLSALAMEFAKTMARTETLSHHAGGSGPRERLRNAGYRSCAWAENIARNRVKASPDALAAALMGQWEKSAGHARNMLRKTVRDVGVGIAVAADGRVYAVQAFGRRC